MHIIIFIWCLADCWLRLFWWANNPIMETCCHKMPWMIVASKVLTLDTSWSRTIGRSIVFIGNNHPQNSWWNQYYLLSSLRILLYYFLMRTHWIGLPSAMRCDAMHQCLPYVCDVEWYLWCACMSSTFIYTPHTTKITNHTHQPTHTWINMNMMVW